MSLVFAGPAGHPERLKPWATGTTVGQGLTLTPRQPLKLAR
jgi:hypothetical protein